MVVLGIDPAKVGAVVLVHEGQAIAAASWRTHQRDGRQRYALTCASLPGELDNTGKGWSARHSQRGIPSAWSVGMAVRKWLSPLVMLRGGGQLHVACEGQHVGCNPQSSLKTARWAGALVGPLEGWDPSGAVAWVEPDAWRKLSFRRSWWKLQATEAGMAANKRVAEREGLAFLTKREAAKREAVRCMPALMPGLADLANQVGGQDVFDAAGVTRWRTLQG